MNSAQILALPMGDNDAGAKTIQEYVVKLALLMWQERECADGKRPFGNSGWEYEIYEALVRGGAMDWPRDEYGALDGGEDRWDLRRKADALMDVAIGSMATAVHL
jgi:hypothetical protein